RFFPFDALAQPAADQPASKRRATAARAISRRREIRPEPGHPLFRPRGALPHRPERSLKTRLDGTAPSGLSDFRRARPYAAFANSRGKPESEENHEACYALARRALAQSRGR